MSCYFGADLDILVKYNFYDAFLKSLTDAYVEMPSIQKMIAVFSFVVQLEVNNLTWKCCIICIEIRYKIPFTNAVFITHIYRLCLYQLFI